MRRHPCGLEAHIPGPLTVPHRVDPQTCPITGLQRSGGQSQRVSPAAGLAHRPRQAAGGRHGLGADGLRGCPPSPPSPRAPSPPESAASCGPVVLCWSWRWEIAGADASERRRSNLGGWCKRRRWAAAGGRARAHPRARGGTRGGRRGWRAGGTPCPCRTGPPWAMAVGRIEELAATLADLPRRGGRRGRRDRSRRCFACGRRRRSGRSQRRHSPRLAPRWRRSGRRARAAGGERAARWRAARAGARA